MTKPSERAMVVAESAWRGDRPAEDPEKTKSWGLVTAKPSEYLVHVRRGRIRERSSGQGATCFKLPWDSVAVVPTSLQRLSFVADQVTAEKVGVQVTGLAVYRIAEPRIAYRVLNFSYAERAQEKLCETLTAMLVGATRRLIANLGVEEAMQKRKSAIGDELLAEIAPVVGGHGRVEDETDRGWGVVLDTIEIQDVRVLSSHVFEAMQAPYRSALDRAAREARAKAEERGALAEAESRHAVERAEIDAAADVESRRDEVARARAEAKTVDQVRRAELEIIESEARTRAQEALLAAADARAEMARAEQHADLERRRAEADVAHAIARSEVEVAKERAIADQAFAEARARVCIAENLPALAAAVGERFGEVKITHIGGEAAAPIGSIAQAVSAVLELARDAGLGHRGAG